MGEILIDRFQLFSVLILAAPAGDTIQDVVQPDAVFHPKESPLIAVFQAVRLRHPSFGQRRAFGGSQLCQPLWLIRGDPYVVLFRIQTKAIQGSGFQLGPPAAGAAAPAVAQVCPFFFENTGRSSI